MIAFSKPRIGEKFLKLVKSIYKKKTVISIILNSERLRLEDFFSSHSCLTLCKDTQVGNQEIKTVSISKQHGYLYWKKFLMGKETPPRTNKWV